MQKARYFVLIVIILTSILLSSSILSNGHDWGGDFAAYIMQAKSLLSRSSHDFIERSAIMVEQSDVDFAPIAYPWGYPFLLAPIIYLFGINLLAIKLLNVILYALFLWVLFLFFQQRFSLYDTLMLVAFFAINPVFLLLPNYILSDIAFLLFSTLGVFLVDSFYQKGHIFSPRILERLVLGVVIFAAFFIRTNGLLLLLSLLGYEIFSYQRRKEFTLAFFIPYLVFMILWILSFFFLPNGQSSHLSFYRGINLVDIWKNAIYYFELGSTFFRYIPNALFVYYSLFFFFVIGVFYRHREDLFFIIYFMLTLALYVSWPFRQGMRFLLPIFPFFLYFSLQGMKAFFVFIQKKSNRDLPFHSVFFTLLLIPFIPLTISSTKNALTNPKMNAVEQGPYDEISSQMFDYVIHNTLEDSVIIFFKPRVMRLITDRDSIIITECLHLMKGDYIVLNREEGGGEQVKWKQFKSCSVPLDEIFISERFIMYKVLEDKLSP